jgi:hypothetical protein
MNWPERAAVAGCALAAAAIVLAMMIRSLLAAGVIGIASVAGTVMWVCASRGWRRASNRWERLYYQQRPEAEGTSHAG